MFPMSVESIVWGGTRKAGSFVLENSQSLWMPKLLKKKKKSNIISTPNKSALQLKLLCNCPLYGLLCLIFVLLFLFNCENALFFVCLFFL